MNFQLIPGLRLLQHEDGLSIATCIRAGLRRDHLFFVGQDLLGIYYERRTPRAAQAARKWWARQVVRVGGTLSAPLTLDGDYDGIVLFHPDERRVPSAFLKTVRNPAGKGGYSGSKPSFRPKNEGPST